MGVMEDKGLLFGLIKLLGAGGRQSSDISEGEEKSPISLFKIMPVDGESNPAPKG